MIHADGIIPTNDINHVSGLGDAIPGWNERVKSAHTLAMRSIIGSLQA